MTIAPIGWTSDRLKDVAAVNADALPASTSPEYEFDYLEISNVDYHGVIDQQRIVRMRFENAPSRARRCAKAGSTIVSSVRPNLQAVAYIGDWASADLVCSTGFNSVEQTRLKLHPKFAYYVLVSENARQHFEATAKGVGYPAVDDKDFKALAVPMPPLDEQERIAAFLDQSCEAIDKAIAAKRQQVEVLNSVLDSTIVRVTTCGLRDDALTKPSGLDWLRSVPAHWKVQQIKRRCELMRGKFSHRPRNDPALYDGDYPFVQTGDITAADKYIRSYSQTLNELGFSVSKMFPKGTLVMSIAANVGDVAILDFEACFPDSMVGLVPDHRTDLDFLFYLMRAMKSVLLRSAVLTTQLNLNYVRIGTNFAPFPPHDEQREIAQYLDEKTAEVRSVVDVLRQQIDVLGDYRKSLIHEYVTGLRRVPIQQQEKAVAYG